MALDPRVASVPDDKRQWVDWDLIWRYSSLSRWNVETWKETSCTLGLDAANSSSRCEESGRAGLEGVEVRQAHSVQQLRSNVGSKNSYTESTDWYTTLTSSLPERTLNRQTIWCVIASILVLVYSQMLPQLIMFIVNWKTTVQSVQIRLNPKS